MKRMLIIALPMSGEMLKKHENHAKSVLVAIGKNTVHFSYGPCASRETDKLTKEKRSNVIVFQNIPKKDQEVLVKRLMAKDANKFTFYSLTSAVADNVTHIESLKDLLPADLQSAVVELEEAA